MSSYETALSSDPEVADLIGQELHRQQTTLQLIASENFTSPAVLAASGSVLTNKYSEGYPGAPLLRRQPDHRRGRGPRPRPGRPPSSGPQHANVQPHAGANANLAAYQALLEPGATILAMRLDHGGHLTHGSPASIISKIWRFVSYGVTPESGDDARPGEVIDFDQVAHLAKTEKPALIVAGSTAYARVIDPVPFREIADSVGAHFMFDAAHPAGLDRRRRAPEPGRHRRRRDPHHAQDPARPPRRRHSLRRGTGQEDRQRGVPGPPGRTARARDRRQGGRLRRGGPAGVPPVRRRGGRERLGPGDGPGRTRASGWSRAAPTTTCCSSTCAPSTPSSPARRPKRCWIGPVSPSTATRSPTTPARRSSPRDCAWARRPRPPPAWDRSRWRSIAELVARTLKARTDEGEIAAIRREVADSVRRLPALPRSRGLARARHRLVRRRPGHRCRGDRRPARCRPSASPCGWATSPTAERPHRAQASRSPTAAVRPCFSAFSSRSWWRRPCRRSARATCSKTRPRCWAWCWPQAPCSPSA